VSSRSTLKQENSCPPHGIFFNWHCLKNSSDGTSFIISYTPVEYGKVKLGKLVIKTDDMYWSFTVKGTFPQYKPPNLSQSRIDNRLNSDILGKLNQKDQQPKNWINNNINKFKDHAVGHNQNCLVPDKDRDKLDKHNAKLDKDKDDSVLGGTKAKKNNFF
jgi:hypothetical protein